MIAWDKLVYHRLQNKNRKSSYLVYIYQSLCITEVISAQKLIPIESIPCIR